MITQFKFTDVQLTAHDMHKQGINPLSTQELKALILNKSVQGNYCVGRRYTLLIDAQGEMRGANDLGIRGVGRLIFDEARQTLTTDWDNGWDVWTGQGYLLNQEIKFFEVNTGRWVTTFTRIESLDISPIRNPP